MKKLFGLLSLLILSGCSNLRVIQPYGMMEIPEVTDAGVARSFDYGLVPALEYQSTTDASRRPLVFDPTIEKSSSYYVRLRLPIEKAGIEFALGMWGLGGFVGNFKYQFLGQRLSKAKAGDWSMAIALQGSGESSAKKSGDQNGTFGAGGNRWEGELSSTQGAGSLLIGFRPLDVLMIYFGPYHSSTNIKGSVSHKPSDDGTDPGAEYEYSDTVTRQGPMLGIFWKPIKKMSFQLEAYHLRTSFTENLEYDTETVGALGMRWDFF